VLKLLTESIHSRVQQPCKFIWFTYEKSWTPTGWV